MKKLSSKWEKSFSFFPPSSPNSSYMDLIPPGSSVHGILQAGILEWVAIPFSRGSFRPKDGIQVSCIAGRFFVVWSERVFHTCSSSQFGRAAIQALNSHMWLLATMLNNVPLEININNWLIVVGRISQRGWKSEIILKAVRARLDNFYEEHFLMWEN